MSTGKHLDAPAGLASSTLRFAAALDAWVKRASLDRAGESVTRLRLLNELHCTGPQKMVDLAGALGVTPRAITAIVDALEREEQVRRVAHPTDRRVTIVELTGGAATVEEQFEALSREVEILFADVEPSDRVAFERTVTRLLSRLDEKA